jgi:hypothetical protein
LRPPSCGRHHGTFVRMDVFETWDGGSMHKSDWTVRALLLIIAVLLAAFVFRPYWRPEINASADSGRFDYVYVVSPMFLYQGGQGVLLMDKRNGNVWFIGRGNDVNISFRDPVFVTRVPLEKLDQAPR